MDGLAGDHSEGPLTPEQFAAALDRTLERWDPDGDELDDLEQLLDRDEQVHPGGDGGLFSADGRRALRAAIARRRA